MSYQPKLDVYHALLQKWAKSINLVSPATLADSKHRHFDDSIQLVDYIPVGTKTIYDLGSGAGFPGLVLGIACPDIKVHLFESDTKKCTFLSTVSRETKTPVIIHNDRIESVNNSTLLPPDVITARALASLDKLLEMTEVWWTNNPHITLMFPKGEKADDEIKEALAKYDFVVSKHPSKTDKKAQILIIKDIHVKHA